MWVNRKSWGGLWRAALLSTSTPSTSTYPPAVSTPQKSLASFAVAAPTLLRHRQVPIVFCPGFYRLQPTTGSSGGITHSPNQPSLSRPSQPLSSQQAHDELQDLQPRVLVYLELFFHPALWLAGQRGVEGASCSQPAEWALANGRIRRSCRRQLGRRHARSRGTETASQREPGRGRRGRDWMGCLRVRASSHASSIAALLADPHSCAPSSSS